MVEHDEQAAAARDGSPERAPLAQVVRDVGGRHAGRAQEAGQRRPAVDGAQVGVEPAVRELVADPVGEVNREGAGPDAAEPDEAGDRRAQALGGEQRGELPDQVRPADEVPDARRQLLRHSGGNGGGGGRLADQDPLVSLAQGGSRVEAQLVREQFPDPLVLGDRLGLPAGPGQAEHEQPAQALVQRVLLDQGAQLGDGGGDPVRLDVESQSLGDRRTPLPVEPEALRGGVRPGDAGQRGTVPLALGLAKRPYGRGVVIDRARRAGPDHRRREIREVQRPGARPEQVAAVDGDDHVGAEDLPQAGDVRAHGQRGGPRRIVVPDRVDQRFQGRLTALPEQQGGEHGALLRRAEVELLVVLPGAHRPEHRDPHHRHPTSPVTGPPAPL